MGNKFLSVSASVWLITEPLFAGGIQVDRSRTGQNTHLDRAANGTRVVNISTPNANAVSHNTYIEFNVPTQGIILNNARGESNTQLAGHIYGNENIKNNAASLILNEVSGTNRSQLNGYIEVAGQSADVIVSNPNGITVNGGGFINTPKATLTTGEVSMANGRASFNVERGDIDIIGKGLDARGTSKLEIFTKALKLNASLHANDLDVVTGVNHIDANGKVTSRDSDDKSRPQFSIDSTALGGIYANAISLRGTQKGVGVNLPGEIFAQDRLTISSDGKIIIGSAVSKKDASIKSHASSIQIDTGVHASSLKLTALSDITLHGNTGATQNLSLSGATLHNDGLLAAGVNADFTQATQGTLNLDVSQSIRNEGVLYGLTGMHINTKYFLNTNQAEVISSTLGLDVSQIMHNLGTLRADLTTLRVHTLLNTGVIHANDALDITAEQLNNTKGNIEGLKTVTLNITEDFLNNKGTLFSQNALLLQTGTLEGIDGTIISKDSAEITVSGLMHMDGGYLEAKGLRIQVKEIQANGADLLSYASLDILTQEMTANVSNIQVLGDIDIKATNSFTQNNHALLYATGDIDLETQTLSLANQSTVQSDGNTNITATTLNNIGSTIVAKRVEITAETVNNTDGTIQGSSDVTVNTDTLNNTRGVLQANGNVNVTATGNVDNTEGTIYSGEGTTVTANELNNEEGFIGSVKAVFLDLFGLIGDNGTVSGDGVTIHTTTVNANNATTQSTGSLDILASGDVRLTDSALLSHGELTLHAHNTNLNGSTLYSGYDTIHVNAATLDAQNAYIEANQALILNASQNVNVSGSTLKGLNIDLTTTKDIVADTTNIVASHDMDIEANTLTHSNGQFIANNDLMITLTGTLQQNNAALIAYHNTNISAQNHTLSAASTLYAANALTLNIAQTLNHTDTSRIISDHSMTINAQTLNLNNASLFAQDRGTVNTTTINNTEGSVSGTQMNIDTATFHNANSHFYSDGGTVNITTTGTLNNNNGLMSANGNLVLDAQTLDNRNGELEAGNTLDVSSQNLQIANSRFFADNQLTVTSNIASIDARSKFLSGDAMDLDFAGNLIHYGEILANGEGGITVHGDFNNHGRVTANDSLTLSAHTLNNHTGASIRGAGDTTITLSGDLNNHHFITSSKNLNITAQNIHNYAGIAADERLTVESINLHNYNTLFSGTDMKLYVTGLMRNYEDANVYARRDLTITANAAGGKMNRLENISATIESEGDMTLRADTILNKSIVEIAYEILYKNLATGKEFENLEDAMTLDLGYDTPMYKKAGLKPRNNWIENTKALLLAQAPLLYSKLVSYIENVPDLGRDQFLQVMNFLAVETTINNLTEFVGQEAKITSGGHLNVEVGTLSNKDATISAVKDMHINVGLLVNTPTTQTITVQDQYYTLNVQQDHETKIGKSKDGWKSRNRNWYTEVPSQRKVGGTSQIIAGGAITGNINKLNNGVKEYTAVNTPTILGDARPDTTTQTTHEAQNTLSQTDSSLHLNDVASQTNAVTAQRQTQIQILPLAVTPQIYDPSREGIVLPNNPYGLFVTSPDPTEPLIESNPEYTNYNNFISSDYMLERLGYNGMTQTRRLGDAMYETQLIRDAIMAMTGQRFIGGAKDDTEQYKYLMENAVNYAQEVGLKLGVPPTKAQLKNLKEDLVWMEEKTVGGKQVLVPVLYLARDYTKPTGANINANSINLTVDAALLNSGSITAREDMTLHTGTLSNVRGDIKAGRKLNISSIGDIKNLSGKIQGGSVVLTSTQGNIVNKTLSKGIDLQHSVGNEHYTLIDKTASITATKGSLRLDAKNDINNIGANLTAKESLVLKAGNDVNIKTIKDEKSYDYAFDNGTAKGNAVKHTQSNIQVGRRLDIKAGNDANLEAVNIQTKNTVIEAANKVNLTAVVDSTYSESHFEDKGFLSESSSTDMKLAQSVKGTSIKSHNVIIKGKEGVGLESAQIRAKDSVNISSQKGDVYFTAKAYTNASYHEEESSSFGGLQSEKTIDATSSTKLANSSTKAENHIVVAGKNVNIVATDLEAKGTIKLDAKENINIVSGTEASSQYHLKEEKGISLGYSDGRATVAKETTGISENTAISNKASSLSSTNLVISSGQDTNVIASTIQAGIMQVDAGRDFNVLSDRDVRAESEEHSVREMGVEFTLNSRESSVFAGYWEDEKGQTSTESQVVSSNINAGSLVINSQDTNIVGSYITGADININSENIRILSDSTNSNTDAYTHTIKTGVEVAVRQNLSNVVDSVVEVGEAENGSAIAARGLRAYDALQTFSEQPVTAGVTALYEESSTDTHTTNSQVVGSRVSARNSLTMNAVNEVEISGSDVGSANVLNIEANTINIHASQGSYTTASSSDTKNASVGLYGSNMGQATVGYQENEMATMGAYQRNSQVYAGGTATLTSRADTTLSGANINAENLALNVGGDLYMQSLQDTQTIEGSSRGGSVSGNVMIGVPTGASANAGETSGERAWVSQVTGINGRESVMVNVGGTTTLTGASITNLNEQGVEQGNLEVNTQHLVVSDIKDIDTYDSSTAGVGVNNGEGITPSLNSVEYTNNTTDREQITRATIGLGTINTQSTTGTFNRDSSNIQEITRDESSSVELYVSDRSLALLDNPMGEIDALGDKLNDVGLAAHVEILENLPSESKGEDGEGDFIDNTIGVLLDSTTNLGILPSVGNSGGYITQIATQLFGDNRNILVVKDKDKLLALGIPESDISVVSRRNEITGEVIVVYTTDPDKTVRLDEEVDPADPLDPYKIHVSSEDIIEMGIGLDHVFTNGMFNDPTTAIYNQQTQQGGADALLNYNQMHGVLGDMIENVQDHVTSNAGLGSLGTGSSRQTGDVIVQMTNLNDGHVVIGAHSQGTMMTQNGLDQHQESLSTIVQANVDSQFLVQYSGAPVNHNVAEAMITDIYGGKDELKDRTQNGISDVFRSHVAPEDFVGTVLGGQSAGINNSENLGENILAATGAVTDLFGWPDPSAHSYYSCILGCGDDRSTPDIRNFINLNAQNGNGESPRTEDYTNRLPHVDQGLLPQVEQPGQSSNTNNNQREIIDTTGGR